VSTLTIILKHYSGKSKRPCSLSPLAVRRQQADIIVWTIYVLHERGVGYYGKRGRHLAPPDTIYSGGASLCKNNNFSSIGGGYRLSTIIPGICGMVS
jgi:hypothetical protein